MNDMIDPSTGVLLTPSYHGEACNGNGEHPEYECCCDECDYYMFCFPDWNAADFGLTPQKKRPETGDVNGCL